ncbi:peptide MFS transporter [Arthrobacter castelli]|uniref:peptide MFS transporter n=1 Tax=Arthrobacter castelli TaxID=271431 RepID=UPI000423A029|nr:oligopeptide:H+ symporter [Arthrobacter castelli]
MSNDNTALDERDAPSKGNVAGHPRGLFMLTGTELWERLSFYGLQVILVYYIYYSVSDGGLGLPQSTALGVAGAYGASVYFVEILGAWVADRVIAARYVAFLGGSLIMTGHIVLALVPGLTGLLMGLGFLIAGTGFLMPNIYTMVGGLYRNKATYRDAGFAIFYTGIMIGALVGPIVTGFLQTRAGFHVAFGAAAVGMAIGLAMYVKGWKHLPESAHVVPNPLNTRGRRVALGCLCLFVIAVGVLVGSSILTFTNIDFVVMIMVIIASVSYFVVLIFSSSTSAQERLKVIAYIPLFCTGVIFWTLVLQLFTTFAVYAETRVHMSINGVGIPPAYISTFEVVAGIVFASMTAFIWQRMGKKQPSTAMKMALGLCVMAFAYFVFAIIPIWSDARINIWPVIIGMVIFGLAEVMYAPLWMSVTTQAAPRAFSTQMMALHGLSSAAGASLSGIAGQLYVESSGDTLFFGVTAVITVAAALLLVVCRPLFRKAGLV